MSLTSRVCDVRVDLSLVRRPLAWPHHPLLTLSREGEGLVEHGTLVDVSDSPRYRVYLVRGGKVKAVLGRRKLGTFLNATCLYVDYATPDALVADGWLVD